MENHHCWWENSLYMVIFNSYVKLPESKSSKIIKDWVFAFLVVFFGDISSKMRTLDSPNPWVLVCFPKHHTRGRYAQKWGFPPSWGWSFYAKHSPETAKGFWGKFSHSWYHKMGCWILGWARRIMRVKHQNSTGMIEGVWFSILMVQIYLGKLYRPHCDLTGIMVSKEHHPQMAELFRLVKYFHLPSCLILFEPSRWQVHFKWTDPGWVEIKSPPDCWCCFGCHKNQHQTQILEWSAVCGIAAIAMW